MVGELMSDLYTKEERAEANQELSNVLTSTFFVRSPIVTVSFSYSKSTNEFLIYFAGKLE